MMDIGRKLTMLYLVVLMKLEQNTSLWLLM